MSATLRLPLGTHLDVLGADWRALVQDFLVSEAGQALQRFLAARAASGATIYPPRPLRALELTPLAEVRVVIVGQDPYHGPGQAHGLAFSVPDGVRPPPSLRNIFFELKSDVGCPIPTSGNLERWARQGVLLLNAVFTVEAGQPGSHANRGWERLSESVLERVAVDERPKAFLLWGALAQAQRERIEARGPRHLVLAANHPSPLAARRPPTPFLGCRHFSKANEFLQRHGRGVIDWCAVSPQQAVRCAAGGCDRQSRHSDANRSARSSDDRAGSSHAPRRHR
ncbi:MAG: uracil-DNA glycosylase [Burkholderiaceae bacterium]